MCLSKVTKRKPKVKEGIGYKALASDSSGDLFSFYHHNRHRIYQINEWITDTSRCKIFVSPSYGKYPTGFHILRHKKDAISWGDLHIVHPIIVRVRYRKVCVLGFGYMGRGRDAPVVVAKQMLIEKVYRNG